MKNLSIKLITIILLAFGFLSLFLTVSVIFDLFGVREREGNFVLSVVWANFLCGILYLIASYGFTNQKRWTFYVLIAAFFTLIVGFVAFNLHINSGGLYEHKTVSAMYFRISMSFALCILSYVLIYKKRVK